MAVSAKLPQNKRSKMLKSWLAKLPTTAASATATATAVPATATSTATVTTAIASSVLSMAAYRRYQNAWHHESLSLSIYIYIYICTCMYVYVYMCMCVYIYIYIYISIHTHIHMYVYIYIYIHTYRFASAAEVRACPRLRPGPLFLLLSCRSNYNFPYQVVIFITFFSLPLTFSF